MSGRIGAGSQDQPFRCGMEILHDQCQSFQMGAITNYLALTPTRYLTITFSRFSDLYTPYQTLLLHS
jgi:hypothetical protein